MSNIPPDGTEPVAGTLALWRGGGGRSGLPPRLRLETLGLLAAIISYFSLWTRREDER